MWRAELPMRPQHRQAAPAASGGVCLTSSTAVAPAARYDASGLIARLRARQAAQEG
jgi:hypothetical protein